MLREARLEVARRERVVHAELIEDGAVELVHHGLRLGHDVEDRRRGPRRVLDVGDLVEEVDKRRHNGAELLNIAEVTGLGGFENLHGAVGKVTKSVFAWERFLEGFNN